MGGEKAGVKGGGFFNLFDWNRKSRKKLFASGITSPEASRNGKSLRDGQPRSPIYTVDEDHIAGVSSMKSSSDYSYPSSVADEEGNATKAPGVVARLMGLDSLPASVVSEPCSNSLGEHHSQKRSPDPYDEGRNIVQPQQASKPEVFPRNVIDPRSQKMPSSPIEWLHTEVLPSRSAKPIMHQKLLSPIKNPRYISPKNAAHIMEAAARILGPGLDTNNPGRVSPSVLLRASDSEDNTSLSRRTSFTSLTSRRREESSSMNKGSNSSEDCSSSLFFDEGNCMLAKGKEKSVSLAVQAKVNVQRRGEGLSNGNRRNIVAKDNVASDCNQLFRSQSGNHTNRQSRKPLVPSSTVVLRQNNQKQNSLTNKGKLATKSSISNQQIQNVSSGETSSGKKKAVSNLSGISRVGQRKGDTRIELESERSPSRLKDFPQKKRMTENKFFSSKVGSVDYLHMDRQGKHVHPNFVIDEHSRWIDDSITSGTDIVSFTFTSPLLKPRCEMPSSAQVAEQNKTEGSKEYGTLATSSNKARPCLGSNVVSGDALSILLEQKLRELTTKVESPYSNVLRGSMHVLQEAESAFDNLQITSRCYQKDIHCSNNSEDKQKDLHCDVSLSHKLQTHGRVDSAHKDDLSPLSTLEACFSNESCNSSESSESTNESKIGPSSIQSQNDGTSRKPADMTSTAETGIDLSDSASSFVETIEKAIIAETSSICDEKESIQDAEYVKEILSNNGLMLKNHSEIVSRLLFEKLEDRQNQTIDVGEKRRLRRKVLFDCVSECLDMKCSQYFGAGYETWAKGMAAIGKDLAEVIYEEISGWTNMGDWMVDALVDSEMSSRPWKCAGFEIEAFEAGVEIEKEILSSLVDELIVDVSS